MFDQVGVQGSDAIHMVCADGGQVGHAHGLAAVFINDRKLALDGVVSWIAQAYLLQEAAVDLVDQLEVPWQQAAEQVQVPLLQRLRQKCVVGVGHRAGGDVPGPLPLQVAIVNEQTHELRYGDCRVRVVQLNGPVQWEILHAESAAVEATQHVLQ